MKISVHLFFILKTLHDVNIYIEVAQLNTFNQPPGQAGQLQPGQAAPLNQPVVQGAHTQHQQGAVVQPADVQPLSDETIYVVAQKLVQMTQTFATHKLTNGNGTNFWDQFLQMAILIAMKNKVIFYDTHVFQYVNHCNLQKYSVNRHLMISYLTTFNF